LLAMQKDNAERRKIMVAMRGKQAMHTQSAQDP